MKKILLMSAVALVLTVCQYSYASEAGSEPAGVVVPKNGVFETTVVCGAKLDNPFKDASLSASFIAPSGKTFNVEGFYYGGTEWRVRFVPSETGIWRFRTRMETPAGKETASGEFSCDGIAGHGFLKLSTKNPFRYEYADGVPFYPIGIQTCNFLNPDFDGPNADGSWKNASVEEWCAAFEGAVNLVRTQFGQGTTAGCAFALIPKDGPIDRYDLDLAKKLDESYQIHRKYGFSQILILFQDMSLWGNSKSIFGNGRDIEGCKNSNAPNIEDQKRYCRYIVARYGSYVDIWELYNEDSFSPDEYLLTLAKTVRDSDPYKHIVTTNYARPKADWCEILTWHEYMGMPAQEVDAYLTSQIALYKSYGKLVQNTEFGNQGQLSNVDPVKWRIAVWTAFMNESNLLFWGSSGRVLEANRPDARGNANAYIGPDSRKHFKVLADFTKDMPVDMKPIPVGYHEQTDIRTYGLSNGAVSAVYIHHFKDHSKPFALSYKLFAQTGPGRFTLKWINPETGETVATETIETKHQYLEFKHPPVTIDLACRIDRIEADAK